MTAGLGRVRGLCQAGRMALMNRSRLVGLLLVLMLGFGSVLSVAGTRMPTLDDLAVARFVAVGGTADDLCGKTAPRNLLDELHNLCQPASPPLLGPAPGHLPVVTLGLSRLGRSLAGMRGPRAAPLFGPAIRAQVVRYSRLGHWAVAAVIATGAVNAALVLGRVPGLGSPYQALPVLKIALVAAMVAVAVVNRYLFVPRMKGAGADAALRAITRGTLAEIALGAAVLAIVSAFAAFDPV